MCFEDIGSKSRTSVCSQATVSTDLQGAEHKTPSLCWVLPSSRCLRWPCHPVPLPTPSRASETEKATPNQRFSCRIYLPFSSRGFFPLKSCKIPIWQHGDTPSSSGTGLWLSESFPRPCPPAEPLLHPGVPAPARGAAGVDSNDS